VKYPFSKSQRLRNRRDFQAARENGIKKQTPHFIIFLYPKNGGSSRLGLTVSRKVGGAVRRNRVKRLVREVFRLNYRLLGSSNDISVIAKRGASDIDFVTVYRELMGILGGSKNMDIKCSKKLFFP
jgi:ribonuclease P protein component